MRKRKNMAEEDLERIHEFLEFAKPQFSEVWL